MYTEGQRPLPWQQQMIWGIQQTVAHDLRGMGLSERERGLVETAAANAAERMHKAVMARLHT
jgi:hypothetical protein